MSLLTPPFTVPVGQTCVFALPTTTVASGPYGGVCFGGNSYSLDGSSDLNTGSLAYVQWVPVWLLILPAFSGAGFLYRVGRWTRLYTHIYPVLYISASHYGNPDTDCYLLLNGSEFGTSEEPGVGIFSVPSSADSMGNTGAVITSASLGVQLVARGNNPAGDQSDSISIAAVGLAIYSSLPASSGVASVWVNVGNTKPLGS